MATVDLIDFANLVSPFVKSCPQDAIKLAVRKACITFCKRSLAIRSDVVAGDVVKDADDYTITSASDTQPVMVISLYYNGAQLLPKSEEELDIIDSGWRVADPGPATWFVGLGPDRILLNRVPAETITGGFIPRVATRPTETALQVDARLYNEYAETIKHGAISYLMELPEKAWSDPKQSVWHGNRFSAGIQRAKSDADKGFQRQSLTVRNRQW